MTELQIAKNLSLPLDAVTQTFGILGIRGSGKSNTGKVIGEGLLGAGQQVVVIDPTDVWWGLRSSRDGKSAGFPITVLGGNHADLPLEGAAGGAIADFAVEHQLSLILSVRHLSMNDQRRLVADFGERLYHRKGQAEHQQPLQLIIDEADAFAPQRIPSGHERTFGAIDRLVRRGRSAGVGVTLISQRAAVLNKDVLTQIECLVCHRTVSPQDRKALEAWVEAHDAHGQRAEFMGSLASLAKGEAWVWSPGWLELFLRCKVRQSATFDSSATPKVGQRVAAPKKVADVDLAQLQQAMAATIERTKADDPRELRRRITELERQLAARPVADPEELLAAQRAGYAVERVRMEQALEPVRRGLAGLQQTLAEMGHALAQVVPPAEATAPAPAPPRSAPPAAVPKPARTAATVAATNGLGSGERRILTALAQYPQGRRKVQVAILTGYAHEGGGFSNYLSALSRKNYIERGDGLLRITPAGQAALGPFEPLPTGQALLEYWLGQLRKAERAILQSLAGVYPAALTKEQLGRATGYEPDGGGFNNALSRLRTLELIQGRGELRASEDLVG